MKRLCLIALAASTLSHPAVALEVTNLDKVEHRVLLEVAGSRDIRTIAPNATENFIGQPNGRLTLLSAEKPKKGKGVIQSDGILSGIISNGRTEGIPAEDRDSFVIWPDGELNLQQRRRGGKYGR